MPRISDDGTGDSAITQAARVSYGKGTKTVNQDKGLIRYLMRHKHTSPFEQAEIKIHAKMPIFVARQWVRHRTASLNEYSGRYSEMSDEFYIPNVERIQTQSKTNKQGTDGNGEFSLSTQMMMQLKMKESTENSLKEYKYYLNTDMSRELARINLPVSNYTEWYWKVNLLNLFRFLQLRMDSHAQYEIQEYANAIYKMVKPIFPLACEAFENYWLNGCEFSNDDIRLLKNLFKDKNITNDEIKSYIENNTIISNNREKNELIKKLNLENG
jgi:thymidylate synthase (FAD)